MGRSEEAKAAYEKLRREIGDKEAEIEVKKAYKYLDSLLGFPGIVRVSWEDAVIYMAEKREKA